MGFHPGVECVECGGFSAAKKSASRELLRRIKNAYRLAVEASRGTADSMWTSITEKIELCMKPSLVKEMTWRSYWRILGAMIFSMGLTTFFGKASLRCARHLLTKKKFYRFSCREYSSAW